MKKLTTQILSIMVAYTLASAIPLHAGTVQYLIEKGVSVPESLIPPEYIPVG